MWHLPILTPPHPFPNGQHVCRREDESTREAGTWRLGTHWWRLRAHTVIIKTNTERGPGRGWSLGHATNKRGFSACTRSFPPSMRSWKGKCQATINNPGLVGKRVPLPRVPGPRKEWEQWCFVLTLACQAPGSSRPLPLRPAWARSCKAWASESSPGRWGQPRLSYGTVRRLRGECTQSG